ncbi:MAG: efflux RND transporter periplasmic adaptor subunit [Phycisphaerales bacterium]
MRRLQRGWLMACTAAALALGTAHARAQAPRAAPPVEHIGVVAAERDARLGFTVAGQVKAVLVKPGDRVEAGAALIELDDAVGLAQAEVHRLRAESTLAVDASEKQWKLAQVEENLVKEALEKSSAGQFELDRATLKAQLSWLEFQKAKQDRREAELAVKQAEALHALRTLRAPESGVVEEVIVQTGESAEPGRPVVRVVSTERFRVEINPPTAEVARLRVGTAATVRFDMPPGPDPSKPSSIDAPAVISHIASVADARSQTRLVRLTLKNPGDLPAGVQVRVTFAQAEATAATPTAP